jgi:hypothetical protein
MLASDRDRLVRLLTELEKAKERTEVVHLACTVLHAIFDLGVDGRFDISDAESADVVRLLAKAVPSFSACVEKCYLDLQVPRTLSEGLILRSAIEFVSSASNECFGTGKHASEEAKKLNESVEELKRDGTLDILDEIIDTAPPVRPDYESEEEVRRLGKLALEKTPTSHGWWRTHFKGDSERPEGKKLQDSPSSSSRECGRPDNNKLLDGSPSSSSQKSRGLPPECK